LNAAALAAFGDRRSEHYSVVVAPEARLSVSKRFSEKVVGGSRTTSYMAPFIGQDGRRYVAEVDSVRLEDHGHVIGVFGVIALEDEMHAHSARPAHLTPRQHEVLGLLAGGRSTEQIAAQLHLSRETVRNHVRGALRALGAHSRLEAVARARSLGIV
jgi:DNA-binding CsgD family transcriptional regulator